MPAAHVEAVDLVAKPFSNQEGQLTEVPSYQDGWIMLSKSRQVHK